MQFTPLAMSAKRMRQTIRRVLGTIIYRKMKLAPWVKRRSRT